jgi:hypothetical protein
VPAEGSFVMYSAGVGEQALDRLPAGDGSPNSVYTRALLPVLATPGLSLPSIATRVREEVVSMARAAGHKQTPAYYDEMVGDFVLKPGQAKPAAAYAGDHVERAWAAAKDSTSVAVLEAFRAQYGAGHSFYDKLAEERIRELRGRAEEKKKAESSQFPAPSAAVAPPGLGRVCIVQDPTGTPLNVRLQPQGTIMRHIANGVSVRVARSSYDAKGQEWSYIVDYENGEGIGWVIRRHLRC